MAEVAQVETELEVAVAGVSAPKRKGGRLTRVQLNAELAKVHRLHEQEQPQALIELAERHGYKRNWAHQILRVWGNKA